LLSFFLGLTSGDQRLGSPELASICLPPNIMADVSDFSPRPTTGIASLGQAQVRWSSSTLSITSVVVMLLVAYSTALLHKNKKVGFTA